jgi:hypothetical protein
MSESGESQRTLTLADLDRFLALPLQAEAEPTELPARDAGMLDPTPWLNAAAVLAAFDPFLLQPAPGNSDSQERERLLDHLLPLCEQIVDGPQRGLWSLSFSERRAVLKRLARRERMRSALEANPVRPDTPVQRMFERVVDGGPIELARLSRDELAALSTVVDWTVGILDSLPEKAAIRSALARVDLLAPMHRLAGQGFVNRHHELEQLERYVFGEKPQAPLFMFGPGGVGKSTLLARFILEHLVARAVPFAYIDIDRPTMRPDHPLTLLLETVAQLHLQLNLPANATEALINEITFGIGRVEAGRRVEVYYAGYDFIHYISLFADLLHNSAKANDTVVVFLDTFEEAQFLGSDVVWPLLEFLFELNRSLPTFRVILSGRALPREFMSKAFPNLFDEAGERGLERELSLEHIPMPERPIDLGVLDEGSARELLQNSVQVAGLATLAEDDLDDVIGIVSRNPMCLKLAARLLRDEGVEKLREARSELLVRLKAEKIQALLYGRILHHVHGDDVRKVAYPGLIVRRIAPDVIRQVLAKPCGLTLSVERSEHDIFEELAKEAALVERDPLDGSLRHRADVRRAMLEDLTDHVKAEVVQQIDRAAVAFYSKQSGAISRAEEIYHRLRLRQKAKTLNNRWSPEAADRLKGAGEELPAQQRLWLAAKLGITLDQTVRQTASQEAWEDQVARTANRFLQSGAVDKALAVLHERTGRLPRSPLYALEAEAYRFLGELDEAIRVSHAGVEALSKAGAIDMALDLQLKMVVIEESRGDPQVAEKLLTEAKAIATHSHNEILRLRVQITELRLQRQLRPDARDERMVLRRDALANLTDEILHRLRSQPVLLREVAAELGGEDMRIVRTAIDTLGLEVATDTQAQALARAITTLNTAQASKNVVDPVLSRAVEQFEQTNFDPGAIRKWVTTDLTTSDTRKLGQSLSMSAPQSEVYRDFRTYFRAGVDNTLRIPE